MNYRNPSMGALIASLLLSIVIACVILTEQVNGDKTFEIRMYNKKQFEGRYIKIKVDQPCIDLPPAWDNQVNSVDPMGCVLLYDEPGCRGLRRRLERWSWGSAALRDISFDNMVSSLSPCPVVQKIVIPTDDEL